MSERLISVLTVFYNAEEFMQTSFSAMQKQTHKNWEWVCVDNKSTDNTLKILREWASKDSRIKIVAKEVNGGNSATGCNAALPYFSASHVMFNGPDDELTSDTLEEVVKRIDETGADIIIPDMEMVNKLSDSNAQNFKMVAIAPDKNDKKYLANDRSVILTGVEACKLSLNWRIHAFACYSTEILRKIRFDEEGMNGDEYSERLFFLNAKKVAFSKGTFRYYIRSGSITHKLTPKYFDLFKTQEKLYKLVLDNHFGKKYLDIVNNCVLGLNFKFSIVYHINENKFSKEEQEKIIPILQHGKKLAKQYSTPFEILKNELKIFKYKTFYNFWKYFDKKLRKKSFI